MGRETIFFGTAVLILTNLSVKILSLVYRAILVRLLGGEGLGLFEMIMPVYSFLLVLSSLGVPLAIANLVSRREQSCTVGDIIKTGTVLLAINSVLVTLAVLAAFPFIRELIFSDSRVYGGFLTLVPTIAIISVISAVRAYFQGSHQTSFIGRSQVIEQVIRVACGIAVTYYLVAVRGYPLSVALCGLSLATLLAEGGGTLYLWRKYRRQAGKQKHSFQPALAKLMLTQGAPVTMSRLLTTFTMSCQATLIPKALIAGGFSLSMAATLYGYFSGVAIVVLHLPTIVTGALAVPLIPAIAEAAVQNDRPLLHARVNESLIFTAYTAFPLLALIFWFATPLCGILFDSPQAGPMLALLSLGGIFLYLQQPIIAVLQGLSCFRAIFVNLFVSDALYVLLLLAFYLRGSFSITVAILLFIGNDVLRCTLNLIYLKIKTRLRISSLQFFFKPLLCSVTALFAMVAVTKNLPLLQGEDIGHILLQSVLFFVVFFFMFFLVGGDNRAYFRRLLQHLKITPSAN